MITSLYLWLQRSGVPYTIWAPAYPFACWELSTPAQPWLLLQTDHSLSIASSCC